MMKGNFTKRVFGMAMSMVMLLSTVPVTAAAEDYGIMPLGTVYYSDQILDTDNNIRIPFLKFNGAVDYDNFVPTRVSWTNPDTDEKYQAYCINPAYSGYGDAPDYGINIEKFDNNCIVDADSSGGAGKPAGSKSTAGNSIAAFLEGAVSLQFQQNHFLVEQQLLMAYLRKHWNMVHIWQPRWQSGLVFIPITELIPGVKIQVLWQVLILPV